MISAIGGGRATMKQRPCLTALVTLGIISALILLQGPMLAQSNVGPPAISAAAVKFICTGGSAACRAHGGSPPILDPVHFICSFCTFTGFVSAGFDLHAISQIRGVPPSLQDKRYELDMTVDAPVNKATMMRLMWSVVEKAFHVRWHIEKKSFPAIAMVVGKHTAKFKRIGPDVPVLAPQSDWSAGAIHFQTVAQLATYINADRNGDGFASRQIVDQTGLAGRYKIDLTYAGAGSLPMLALVKEQLGFEFVPTKQTAEVAFVVVDEAQAVSSQWQWQ